MTDQTPEAPELTEADYNIDTAVLLQGMGIDPNTVDTTSVKLQFIEGKAVLTYSVYRAVPSRVLAAAMLNAAGLHIVQPQDHKPPQEPTPIRPTAKGRRTAKKAAPKAAE